MVYGDGCSTWPYGGCDDSNLAIYPCETPDAETWPVYDSDNGSGSGGCGGNCNGCQEGDGTQCKARRREWHADCSTFTARG